MASEAYSIITPKYTLVTELVNEMYRNAALVNVWILVSKLSAIDGDRGGALQAVQAAAQAMQSQEERADYKIPGRRNDRATGQEQILGCGLVRNLAQLRADVLTAEADALLIGEGPVSEPFASMTAKNQWRQHPQPDDATKKKATTLYLDALNKDPYHQEATVGLCGRLIDENALYARHSSEDTHSQRRARMDVKQRLERLVDSSSGYTSPQAWSMLGNVSLSLNIQQPLGVDPFAEAGHWSDQAPLRPWQNMNTSGFVLW